MGSRPAFVLACFWVLDLGESGWQFSAPRTMSGKTKGWSFKLRPKAGRGA
jgi:hypothetical protein